MCASLWQHSTITCLPGPAPIVPGPNVGLGSCKPAGSGYRGPQNMQWTYTQATALFKSASTPACCGSPSRPIPTQGLCLSRGHLAPTPAPGPSPAPTGRVVLLPCNASDPQQAFGFGKGLHSPSSVYHVATDLAIAIANNTLHGQTFGSDAFPVPSAAYGEVNLALVPRWDQDVCTSRDCQNYDNSQMWYYSPTEQLLRASTFVGSINHKNDGNGYHRENFIFFNLTEWHSYPSSQPPLAWLNASPSAVATRSFTAAVIARRDALASSLSAVAPPPHLSTCRPIAVTDKVPTYRHHCNGFDLGLEGGNGGGGGIFPIDVMREETSHMRFHAFFLVLLVLSQRSVRDL